MKDKHEWGLPPYHKVGLLHRWIIREANWAELTPIRWIASCGLWYSYEKNNDPAPNFTNEGIKCKKYQKEQERVNKIFSINEI